jgi:beta-lactamase regulating signal transducer with metallopeptidase domain
MSEKSNENEMFSVEKDIPTSDAQQHVNISNEANNEIKPLDASQTTSNVTSRVSIVLIVLGIINVFGGIVYGSALYNNVVSSLGSFGVDYQELIKSEVGKKIVSAITPILLSLPISLIVLGIVLIIIGGVLKSTLNKGMPNKVPTSFKKD